MMLDEWTSLPFRFPEVYGGFAEGEGLLHFDEDTLTLEYQVRDGLFGVVKSKLKQTRLTFDDISQIELKEGWVRTRLFIKVKRLESIADLPREDGKVGMVVLHIKKRDREAAQRLASFLNLQLSEHRLARLGPIADEKMLPE